MNDFTSILELNALISAMPRGIIVLDEDSVILAVSQRMVKMTGYKEKELLGQNVSMLIPEKVDHPHHGNLKDFIRNGTDAKTMQPLSDVPMKQASGEVVRVDVERFIYSFDGELRFGGAVEFLDRRKRRELMRKQVAEVKEAA